MSAYEHASYLQQQYAAAAPPQGTSHDPYNAQVFSPVQPVAPLSQLTIPTSPAQMVELGLASPNSAQAHLETLIAVLTAAATQQASPLLAAPYAGAPSFQQQAPSGSYTPPTYYPASPAMPVLSNSFGTPTNQSFPAQAPYMTYPPPFPSSNAHQAPHGASHHHKHGGHQHFQQQQQQQRDEQHSNAEATPQFTPFDALIASRGNLAELCRTAAGSSFVQGALKEPVDSRSVAFICEELFPVMGDLLLDAHGCYVVKALVDRLDQATRATVLRNLQADEPLTFSLCTHSLHTRRVVQHIMENYDAHFVIGLLIARCTEVAMTQQGCIVLQRAMDNSTGSERDALFDAVYKNFIAFSKDPFANYVIQHLLEVGNRDVNSAAVMSILQGHVVELSCNKFASNVVEKCLFHVSAEAQHQILVEMYTAGEHILQHMLEDSFGNYIIQSSIALATFRDVWFINEHLRPVLKHTPYGHKIEARLDRRMKGKSVMPRNHQAGSEAPNGQAQGNGPRGPVNRTAGRRMGSNNAPLVPSNEEPW